MSKTNCPIQKLNNRHGRSSESSDDEDARPIHEHEVHPVVPGERQHTSAVNQQLYHHHHHHKAGHKRDLESMRIWLASQLLMERKTVAREMEERHLWLLERFQTELNSCRVAADVSMQSMGLGEIHLKGQAKDSPPVQAEADDNRGGDGTPRSQNPDYSADHIPSGQSSVRCPGPTKHGTVPMLDLMMKVADENEDHEKPMREHGSTGSAGSTGSRSRFGKVSTLVAGHIHLPHMPVGFETTVRGQAFEWSFAAIILANAVIMAMQQQYRGLQIGHDLVFRTYDSTAKDAWPGGEAAFRYLEIFFCIVFTVEIILRVMSYKMKWFHECWNYVDVTIVILAWITLGLPQLISTNPTFVRLARVGKLMRIVRLLRSNSLVDSLKLLVASIRASVNTLFWSLCVLLLIQSLAGLLLGQLLESFLRDESNHVDVRRQVFSYFGTFWRAMITMFEITFANWAPSCRLLINHVDEAYGSFYLLYRCVIGFSVLLVIQAVFIQQTMKTAQLDDDFLAQQKAREKRKLINRLVNIFNRLDESGDGLVDCSEFVPALKDGHMQGMLETFDLEASDFYTLFDMLVDSEGQISLEAFVKGVTMMKGAAKAIDMMEVLHIMKRLEAKIDTVTAMPRERRYSRDQNSNLDSPDNEDVEKPPPEKRVSIRLPRVHSEDDVRVSTSQVRITGAFPLGEKNRSCGL